MVREMEAALDMNAIAALDRVFEQAASRMFSAIEVDEAGIERLRERAKEGTLVLLPSHKSHVDYLALAWVLYRHKLQLPLIAAGDNLNFFPMGPIFRRAGAFFIRRSFAGDRLYAAVVDAYIRRLIKDGVVARVLPRGRPVAHRQAAAAQARACCRSSSTPPSACPRARPGSAR